MVTYKAKRRVSPIRLDDRINYKDINRLKTFITEHGKILSRRTNNLTVKQQKELKKAIKQARILNLLPFVLQDKN
jgi:small subunit ribosomal protein S18|tara:strand:+ start:18758 stop:18982 length:225 start_codon:yes stop_codon:yes gene_type:complete